MRIRSVVIHSAQAIAEGALISVLVIGLTAATAFAAKPAAGTGGHHPSGGSRGTIALVMVTDANGNGLPNFGDQVTFNVSTTATTEPHVDLTCSQNGIVVLGATTGFFASYPWPWTQVMTLSSQSWTGGAADCTAKLYYFSGSGRSTTLATLTFQAGA